MYKIKLTSLIPADNIASNDLFEVVDVNDPTMSSVTGTNKRVTAQLLANSLSNMVTNSANIVVNSGGNAVRVNQSGAGNILSLENNSNTRFVINSNGNVGIGTASPTCPLDISSAGIRINQSRIISSNSNSGGIVLAGGNGANGANIELYGSTHTGSPNMAYIDADTIYFRNAAASSTFSSISSTGLVIGNTSSLNVPTREVTITPKFQVIGTSASNSSILISRFNADAATTPRLFFSKSRGDVIGNYAAVVNNDNLGEIIFGGANGSGILESARIMAEVDGTPSNGNMPSRLVFSTTLGGTGTTPTERMRITSAGFVGIGINPTFRLHLSTDSAAKPSTNTWTINSDERLKENIEAADLDICYNAVKSIPLKRYRWKDEMYSVEQVSDRSKIGWIAQDVQEIFPKAVSETKFVYNQVKDEDGNVVSEDSIDDCLTLNSDQIYASLFGAVQKLIAKVESLESKINQLENS